MAVLPAKPGSVWVTSRSMKLGTSTLNTLPLWLSNLQGVFSVMNLKEFSQCVLVQGNHVKSLHIHKIVEITVVVTVFHIRAFNERFLEFIGGI